MMNKKKYWLFSIVLLLMATLAIAFIHSKEDSSLIRNSFDLAQKQYRQMLLHSKNMARYPRTTDSSGATKYVSISDWTGGFWPGDLWYVYEYTHDSAWKKAAIEWTESLEQNQFNTAHHDLGFMMYCSYGNAYRVTHDERYKQILIQSAKSLISRFSEKTGCIKSWDFRTAWDGKTNWYYPVIIDNMMNLELLFFASKATGDPLFKNIAIRHAETTMKNHIRPDYSTYHVVDYDTLTGKVLHQQTCQGYADNSTWARGQAWAIYGYTMVYRETGDKRFLETAKKLADFYISHPNLPEDKIPFWDFNANQPGYHHVWVYPKKLDYTPRDASAAAIVSSALFELSGFLGKEGRPYKEFAAASLKSLGSPAYLAKPSTNGYFMLKHSVGSIPHGAEIDVPLVYADYYYLEALLRYSKI